MHTAQPTRKQAILDAAARLIIQSGYDKTTIGDVADAIGLNRALVYGYFKSKDDLLSELIRCEMLKYGQLWFDHLMADPKVWYCGKHLSQHCVCAEKQPLHSGHCDA
jgi:AcrR family transcriptional regulator